MTKDINKKNIDIDVDCLNLDVTSNDTLVFFRFLEKEFGLNDKKAFHLSKGRICKDSKGNQLSYQFNLQQDLLFRPQEKKENSTKPKDGYRIEILGDEIGRGGYGMVYDILEIIRLDNNFLFVHKSKEKNRVVKVQEVTVIEGNKAYQENKILTVSDVENEVEIAKKCGEMNVKNPIIQPSTEGKSSVFIVMKKLSEDSLYDHLDPQREDISFNKLLILFTIIVNKIQNIHEKGFVHRDIKPENILLSENISLYDDFDKDNIFIADFGTTAAINSKVIFAEGTDGYRDPEALIIGTAITENMDIFSLGYMLYADFAPLVVDRINIGKVKNNFLGLIQGKDSTDIEKVKNDIISIIINKLQSGFFSYMSQEDFIDINKIKEKLLTYIKDKNILDINEIKEHFIQVKTTDDIKKINENLISYFRDASTSNIETITEDLINFIKDNDIYDVNLIKDKFIPLIRDKHLTGVNKIKDKLISFVKEKNSAEINKIKNKFISFIESKTFVKDKKYFDINQIQDNFTSIIIKQAQQKLLKTLAMKMMSKNRPNLQVVLQEIANLHNIFSLQSINDDSFTIKANEPAASSATLEPEISNSEHNRLESLPRNAHQDLVNTHSDLPNTKMLEKLCCVLFMVCAYRFKSLATDEFDMFRQSFIDFHKELEKLKYDRSDRFINHLQRVLKGVICRAEPKIKKVMLNEITKNDDWSKDEKELLVEKINSDEETLSIEQNTCFTQLRELFQIFFAQYPLSLPDETCQIKWEALADILKETEMQSLSSTLKEEIKAWSIAPAQTECTDNVNIPSVEEENPSLIKTTSSTSVIPESDSASILSAALTTEEADRDLGFEGSPKENLVYQESQNRTQTISESSTDDSAFESDPEMSSDTECSLADAAQKVTSLSEKNVTLEGKDIQNLTEIKELEAKLATQTQEVKTLQEEKAQNLTEIKQLQTDLTAETKEVESSQKERLKLLGQVEQLKNDLAAQAEKIATLEKEKAQNLTEIKQLQTDLAAKKKEVESSQKERLELLGQVEQLKTYLADEAKKVETLQAEKTQSSNVIAQLKANLATQVEKTVILEGKDAQNLIEREELQTALKNETHKVEIATKKLYELANKRQEHDKALKVLEKSSKEELALQKQVKKLTYQVEEKVKKISKIKAQVVTTENKKNQQKVTLNKLNTEKSILDESLKNARDSLVDKTSQIKDKKNEITILTKEQDRLTSELKEGSLKLKKENNDGSMLLDQIKIALKETSFANKCLGLSLGTGLGLSLSAAGTLTALALTTALLSPLGPTVVIGLIAGSALFSTAMLIGAIYLAVRKSATQNMRIALGGGLGSGVSLGAAGALTTLALTTALLSPLAPSIVIGLIAGSATIGLIMLLGTVVLMRQKTQSSGRGERLSSASSPQDDEDIVRQDSSSSVSENSNRNGGGMRLFNAPRGFENHVNFSSVQSQNSMSLS